MSFCKKKFKSYKKSRTSERASFACQTSKVINSRKPSKASKPTKNGKSLFFSKRIWLKLKKNKKKCHFEKKLKSYS